MKRIPILVGLGCVLAAGTVSAGPADGAGEQHAQTFEKEIPVTVRSDYLLYLPETYATTEDAFPLVLFLHGAGERGDDVNRVAIHGPPKRVREGKAFPFVLVSPQCPQRDWWTSALQLGGLNALLDDILARYRIDEDRVYVTGLSMGGFGSWALAAAYPERFAAMAPVCGGGEPGMAPTIAHIPSWVFHGAKDPVVPMDQSQQMVDALKSAGGDVTFTVYPEAGHDSWTETYDNPELYQWLLGHTRNADAQKK